MCCVFGHEVVHHLLLLLGANRTARWWPSLFSWLALRFTTIFITRPCGGFPCSLLDNQEDTNTGRCVFEKLSARCLQRRPFWHRNHSHCGDIEHAKSARGGCDTFRRTTGVGNTYILVYDVYIFSISVQVV